jgi:hypothetical protein
MRRPEDPTRDPASEMRDDHFKPDALDAPRRTPERGTGADYDERKIRGREELAKVFKEMDDQLAEHNAKSQRFRESGYGFIDMLREKASVKPSPPFRKP